jgi:hypothetical protein
MRCFARRAVVVPNVLLALAVTAPAAFAADPPVVVRDCESIHPLPRPCDGHVEVTPDTSIYFEVTVSIAGHYPQDGVDPDSIVATIEKEGHPPVTMFGPGQVFHPGYSGAVIPEFFASPDFGHGFYIAPDAALDPLATYTVHVSGQTKLTETPIDPATSTWSFTTRRDLAGSALAMAVDLGDPTVHWAGYWFAGEVKPNFNTSRVFDQEGVYDLIEAAAQRAPGFFAEQRDYPWMGDYWQATIFDGNPNLVRERETRRILEFRDFASATELTLTDLEERALYGIPPGRPLSEDYHVDDLVLVCDATQSEVRRVLAVDDAANTVRVEKLETPAASWSTGDPSSAPQDDPDTPDHFTHPLAALRKYSPVGTPVYYWERLDDELDQHVAHGRRPQVNPFAAPLDLCETGVPKNSYGGYCDNKPKDWQQWDGFIRTLIGHLIDRYGEQVLDWTYSIGNEPDLSQFWRNSNEFSKYYNYTANAILRTFEQRGLDASRISLGGVEVGVFHGKINDMLYLCSPTADSPNPDLDEKNAVCFDPAFEGDRAARIDVFCTEWDGEGCPLDFISLHTYSPAAEAASSIITARNKALEIDPVQYAELEVDSHETTPDWKGARDPGWKEVFRWGGFFPTWGADYFRRLLDEAILDSRKAGGQATVTAWPFNYNFAGDASIAGFMRVDEDGDGTEDRVDAVASSFFRFAELAAWMGHDLAPLATHADAGALISGWRGTAPEAERFLLYAHDPLDVEARETDGWDVTLELSNVRFPSVAVTEYRIDQHHGARDALDALPDRGQDGVYGPDELVGLVAASELTPVGPEVCAAATAGALDLVRHVASQGVTYLELTKALAPAEVEHLAFEADGETLTWRSAADQAGPGTVHDLVRGSLGQLPVGAGDAETCLASGIAAAEHRDAQDPAAGAGFWYVVRGRNACGTGTYGRTSSGGERSTETCP